MYLINNKNESNETIPIAHKCDEIDIGRPMTEADLHEFAVALVMVYYYQQEGDIKSINYNLGIEYPHIVMENVDCNKLYYVTVKAGIHPDIPEPLPSENYSTLIELAEETNAIPVFIGVTFTNYSADDYSPPICGGEYIVKITRLKKL